MVNEPRQEALKRGPGVEPGPRWRRCASAADGTVDARDPHPAVVRELLGLRHRDGDGGGGIGLRGDVLSLSPHAPRPRTIGTVAIAPASRTGLMVSHDDLRFPPEPIRESGSPCGARQRSVQGPLKKRSRPCARGIRAAFQGERRDLDSFLTRRAHHRLRAGIEPDAKGGRCDESRHAQQRIPRRHAPRRRRERRRRLWRRRRERDRGHGRRRASG